MKKTTYRMASWWLLWEDIIFPEPGIEEKIVNRARKFKDAGIDTVVIFGAHFRWDFIYNWERLHQLLKFIVDCCHEHEIRVFDHHSANLTHRVSSMEQYRNVNWANRHHVPFFPSREFAEELTFRGHKLNDFRMISVQNGKPCYLDVYNAESFCMNNPDFASAYKVYLEKLLDETDIDGLMCDDVIYYPGWDGCACDHCRKKFKDIYGHDLPPVTNEDFWGNYESPAFKDWISMRFRDPVDFLNSVKKTVGDDFPLLSCCSSSSAKVLNGYGLNAAFMARAVNNIMLEICGEITSEETDYQMTVPDFVLHKAVADNHGYPNIGLGYAHNCDSAFLIWAFNKMFASNTWISTLTGRLGIKEEIRKTLPDEADIIKEAYTFEKQYPHVFTGESSSPVGVYFSQDNLLYNGCAQGDYSQGWFDLTKELFEQNIQFDIVCDIPTPQNYPILLLISLDCVSSEIEDKLLDYMEQGGEIIAIGAVGFRNEYGELKENHFLKQFGIKTESVVSDWKIPAENLFNLDKRCPVKSNSSYIFTLNGNVVDENQWLHFIRMHWLPETRIGKRLIEKLKERLPNSDIKISCPQGWRYRVFDDTHSRKSFVHFLSSDIQALPYENFQNNLIKKPVIEKLKFAPAFGQLSIETPATKVTMHSPDLSASVNIEGVNNIFCCTLDQTDRYFIIEICQN